MRVNNNQAAFLARCRDSDAQLAEIQKENAARFRNIERILAEHTRLLQALPEAVREKIGFRAPG